MDPNKDLIARLERLEQWKAQKERQQLSYPMDPTSVAVLQNYFMRINNQYEYVGGVSGNTFLTYVGSQGNMVFEVSQSLLSPYTVDATTDVLTVADGRFDNDRIVYVVTSDIFPAPLDSVTLYYVVNGTNGGKSFQLSLTSGGAAVNITTTGTGRQFIGYSFN